MANVKVGDKVAGLGYPGVIIKTVKEIKSNTLFLLDFVDVFDYGTLETLPKLRQNPANWRLAVPETINKIQSNYAEIKRLEAEVFELFYSLPKVEL